MAPLPFQITIARQPGSGGSALGQALAGRLGLVYLDRQILRQAAAELGMSEAELAHREERIQSFWKRLIQTFAAGSPEQLGSPAPMPDVSDEDLIAAEHRVLLNLAARGSCVIVGRCGFYLLKEKAPVFNLFVHAPRAFRMDRMRRFYGARDKTEAGQMIDRIDRDRERYIRKLAECSWYDARNYHLSIDMARVGFSPAVEAVASIVQGLRSAPEQNPDLSDPGRNRPDKE